MLDAFGIDTGYLWNCALAWLEHGLDPWLPLQCVSFSLMGSIWFETAFSALLSLSCSLVFPSLAPKGMF